MGNPAHTWFALVTFVAASLLMPVTYRFLRHRILDAPTHRSSHLLPTPRGAGLACLGAFVLAIILSPELTSTTAWSALYVVLLSAVGFADDVLQAPPVARLGAQVLLGGLLGYAVAGLPGAGLGSAVSAIMVNTVNFMDGINGITGLVLASWGATLAVATHHNPEETAFVLGSASLGCALAFLPYNLPSGKFFLGDVGSYLFGALAASGILLALLTDQVSPLIAISPLSIYITDVAVTLARRARRGAPLLEAHREHIYQRISDYPKWTHARTSALVSLLSLLAGASTLRLSTVPALVCVLVLCTFYAALPTALARRHRRRTTEEH